MTSSRDALPRVSHAFTSVSMDTGVTIHVVTSRPRDAVEQDVLRALAWFDAVERICTRFDRNSEVMQLLDRIRQPWRSYAAVRLIARSPASNWAAPSTERSGAPGATFNTNYTSGERIQTP
jgi:hypothetical protein